MISIKKINLFSYIGIIFLLLCSCLLVGCFTPEKRFKKDQLTITYLSQASLDSEIKKLRLKHPIKILKGQVINHLLSLYYEELSLFGKKKYVFSSNDVFAIAPSIAKALNLMKASKVLYFEIETPKGKTAGTLFRAGKKINWIFESINGSNFLGTGFVKNRGASWKLLPKNGQRFHKEQSIVGNQRKNNWIVSDLNLQAQSRRGLKLGIGEKISKKKSAKSLKERKPKIRASSENGEFKKSLQFLKDLRSKELIDDAEYKNKKTELLGQFP